MEEAVCTSRDSLITVYTTRAKHTDWRFVCRHIVCLIIRSVATEKNVLRNVHRTAALNEEGILHITCRMISSKVQHSKHVLVVINLWTLIESETHTSKDINNLVLYKCQRMTCTEVNRISSTCQVDIITLCLTCFKLVLEFVNLVLCTLLKFINLHADNLLLVGCHITELAHQRIDFTLLTKVFQTELLHIISTLSRECAHFLEKFFYLV